jgi:predicted nucleic acid-binding protein
VTPLVLDAGAITRLGEDSRAARTLARRLDAQYGWHPLVPTVVLTEALRGDHRLDFNENRLLAECEIVPVDESTARRAARLRTLARRGSAVDAIVVALAETVGGLVLTQDAPDLRALAAYADGSVRVERV